MVSVYSGKDPRGHTWCDDFIGPQGDKINEYQTWSRYIINDLTCHWLWLVHPEMYKQINLPDSLKLHFYLNQTNSDAHYWEFARHVRDNTPMHLRPIKKIVSWKDHPYSIQQLCEKCPVIHRHMLNLQHPQATLRTTIFCVDTSTTTRPSMKQSGWSRSLWTYPNVFRNAEFTIKCEHQTYEDRNAKANYHMTLYDLKITSSGEIVRGKNSTYGQKIRNPSVSIRVNGLYDKIHLNVNTL